MSLPHIKLELGTEAGGGLGRGLIWLNGSELPGVAALSLRMKAGDIARVTLEFDATVELSAVAECLRKAPITQHELIEEAARKGAEQGFRMIERELQRGGTSARKAQGKS